MHVILDGVTTNKYYILDKQEFTNFFQLWQGSDSDGYLLLLKFYYNLSFQFR